MNQPRTRSHPSRTAGVVLLAIFTTLPAPASPPDAPKASIREELVAARETIWRAFYAKDPAALEALLGPELVAVQEGEETWRSRVEMLSVARQLVAMDARLIRLEFPRTEIQVFGDTAIMYYTYVFETSVKGKSLGVDAGRGTEVFVRRDGKWVDVGWHLDNGAFVLKDGRWTRVGTPAS